MAKYWVIEASYSGYNPDLDNKLEQLLGDRTGSGAGFGQRDIDWTFSNRGEADEKFAILQEYAKTLPSQIEFQIGIREHDDNE